MLSRGRTKSDKVAKASRRNRAHRRERSQISIGKRERHGMPIGRYYLRSLRKLTIRETQVVKTGERDEREREGGRRREREEREKDGSTG